MTVAAIALALIAPLCLWQTRQARSRLDARARALARTYRSRYPQRWQALPAPLAQGAWPEVALQRMLADLDAERKAVRAALAPLRRPLHAWLALSVISVTALAALLWQLLYA